jgi:hypothetical protein
MLNRQQYFLMYNTPIVMLADEGYPSAIMENPTILQRADFSQHKNSRIAVRKFDDITKEELEVYNSFVTDILAIDYLRSVGIEYEVEYYEKEYCIDISSLDLSNFKKI